MQKIKNWVRINYKRVLISVIFISTALFIPKTLQFSLLLRLFAGYLGLFILTSVFPKNRVFEILKLIIGIPYLLIILISPFYMAGMSILFSLVYSFGIPAISILLINEVSGIALSDYTIYYLGLTVGSLIFLLFGNRMISKTIEIIESNRTKERVESQTSMTLKILNQKTYRVIIYSGFFILLFATSIYDFQNSEDAETLQWTTPILKSFVTIVAFDRIALNGKQLKLVLKEMKQDILNVYKTYLE